MPGQGSARSPAFAGSNGSSLASFERFWKRTYVSDYIGLTILMVGYLFLEAVEPFHRMFFLDNINIQYPHAEVERVPLSMLFVYAGVVPLVVMLVWVVFAKPSLHASHVTLLGLLISLILTSFTTDIIKNAVGRPRPDLIARCKPEKGTPAHQLVTYKVCTEKDHHTLHDGWRSFPSGHSSFAFAGLGYLAFFLAGQMHVLRPRADLTRGLLAFLPLLGAAMIAISRCEDYRHDVYDVTCGAILGLLLTYFTYRRYYPSLQSKDCHLPYSGPEMTHDKLKRRDEEAEPAGAGDYEVGEDDEEENERRPLARTRA